MITEKQKLENGLIELTSYNSKFKQILAIQLTINNWPEIAIWLRHYTGKLPLARCATQHCCLTIRDDDEDEPDIVINRNDYIIAGVTTQLIVRNEFDFNAFYKELKNDN